MNSIAASTQPPLPPFSTAAAAHKPRIQPAREFDVNKRKQMKAKWLLFPFICFHEFFRIGTFQRVTADSNKKIRLGFCSRLRLCAKDLQSDAHAISLSGTGRILSERIYTTDF
jgi:hypothetical protein